MELLAERKWFGPTFAVSSLSADGIDLGLIILEDKVREILGRPVPEWTVYAETAIPYGRYKIIRAYFPTYKRDMPLLLDVPGYTGIFMHTGEKVEDTAGCLITGKGWQAGTATGGRAIATESWAAFNVLWPRFEAAWAVGEAWVRIVRDL